MKFSAALLVTLSVMVLFFSACSDKPAREKFPGAEGRTTESMAAQTSKAVLGGFDPSNNQLPGQDQPARNVAKSLKGEITVGRNVKVKPGMTFFLAVRPIAGGPPLAVRRLSPTALPYSFVITEADQMMQGTDFSGPVEVTARLDQDGDPLTRQPGDWMGTLKTSIGDQKVNIVIDQPAE